MPAAQYCYFDGLGSTVMMTEGLSTVTDRYDYDAWGNEYPIMASTADNPYQYVGQLGYYTHWMDPSLSDLLHLGLRFYEPGVGRFGQVDRARDGLNWYVYAGDVPSLLVDPTGCVTQCQMCIGCLAAFFGGAVAGCTSGCWGDTNRTQCILDCLKDVFTERFMNGLPYCTKLAIGVCAGQCFACGFKFTGFGGGGGRGGGYNPNPRRSSPRIVYPKPGHA